MKGDGKQRDGAKSADEARQQGIAEREYEIEAGQDDIVEDESRENGYLIALKDGECLLKLCLTFCFACA